MHSNLFDRHIKIFPLLFPTNAEYMGTPWWGGGELTTGEALTYSPWWKCTRPASNNRNSSWYCSQLDSNSFTDYSDSTCTLDASSQKNRIYAIRAFVIITGSFSLLGAFIGLWFAAFATDRWVGIIAAVVLCLSAVVATTFGGIGIGVSVRTFKDYLYCNHDVCTYLTTLHGGGDCTITFYHSAYLYYVSTALPLINVGLGIALVCYGCHRSPVSQRASRSGSIARSYSNVRPPTEGGQFETPSGAVGNPYEMRQVGGSRVPSPGSTAVVSPGGFNSPTRLAPMATPQRRGTTPIPFGGGSSVRRQASEAPPADGFEPPANGDWVWDIDNQMFWSQKEYLFLNPKDGHFFDPDSQHWFNPDTEAWYPAN
eukprot:GDKK01046582.1.p1 GENE.GDKK01046582.1~~GDKK01046582.1.p1  ORF type:complete len:369 (+),score=-10.46 GDKK01046582.1:327-1433(+)